MEAQPSHNTVQKQSAQPTESEQQITDARQQRARRRKQERGACHWITATSVVR